MYPVGRLLFCRKVLDGLEGSGSLCPLLESLMTYSAQMLFDGWANTMASESQAPACARTQGMTDMLKN